nr:PREDICTED: cingulin-like [Anolis carolinensis]|eukprot:XP_016851774.1 PREDICTED: cingulin-like [Anolis carolinensis]
MYTPKPRIEKDPKDWRTMTRRNSLNDDVNLKDLLRELQNISNKQDTLQKEVKSIVANQEALQKEVQAIAANQEQQKKLLQEEMLELKKEMREELGSMKKELSQNSNDRSKLKLEKKIIHKSHLKIQKQMEGLEFKNTKLEKIQEKLEQSELEYQLRFRNVQEETKENIKAVIIQIIAKILQCTDQEAVGQVDRVYRVQTYFAKQNRGIRDVIVHFVKKSTRDEVLRGNLSNPVSYKERKIVILKEISQSIMIKRKKHYFLTDELKRRNIRFRWEKYEGLMTTYNGEKFWLTTEEKARDFYKKLRKDRDLGIPELSPEEMRNPKDAKKRRFDSPKETGEALGHQLKDEEPDGRTEEEEEEEEDGEDILTDE